MKNSNSKIIWFIVALILLNLISSKFYQRFDLTEDARYSLSEPTKNIIQNINSPIFIEVYLEGNFPAEFKRLQIETKLHLEELSNLNNKIRFKFINPENKIEELFNKGLTPSNLQIQESGSVKEIIILPWAVVKYNGKSENISLLKDIYSNTQNEQLEASIQNLEYAFASAIQKLTVEKSKKIAVLRGNGELEDIRIHSLLSKLGENYFIAPFTLDSVANNPIGSLEQLSKFDLAIIAKPTQKFSEKEKYTLDQFIMNGGKTLWLIDNVQAELDSLMNTGEALAYPRDLGLTDLLFSYGVRLNTDLITDLYSSEIPLATGKVGNKTQFNSFLWKYFPLVNSKNSHPINSNIEAVNFKFANSIDTLKNSVSKTILLASSIYSKPEGTPKLISLNTISAPRNQKDFNNGSKFLSVLLEGNFKSAYSERIKPFNLNSGMLKSKPNKIIVISDGDVISNDILKGQPTELGIDKWTNQQFGNKEFLLNCVNYLLDNSGLIELRSKKIKINFLDKQKAYSEATKWQTLNIVIPLILLGLFGVIFNYLRRKKYR